MADLISREAAIKLLRGKCVGKYPSTFMIGLFAAADEIDKLPAADAVEVVRCKDCLYYNTYCCSPGCGWCEHFERGEFDNHYCYGADRREENAAD